MSLDLHPPLLSRSVLAASDARRWSAVLSRFVSDFYHAPGYVAHAAEAAAATAVAFVADTRHGSLFLPLLVRSIVCNGELRGVDAGSPYGYPGPLVRAGSDADARRTIAAAAPQFAAFAAELGLVSAIIRMHPLLTLRCPEWSGWGHVVEHGPTLSIDLAPPAESWWRTVRRSHRYAVRKLKKEGFDAFEDVEWRYLGDFVAAYAETMTRAGAAASYFFPRPYFEMLRSVFGKDARLLVVRHGNAFAAGGIFVCSGGPIAQYHLAATPDAFVPQGPGKLVFPLAYDIFRARGASALHLGGGVGARKDSLFAFKSGFANTRHSFATLRCIFDADAYDALCSRTAPARSATEFFPAYRAPAVAP